MRKLRDMVIAHVRMDFSLPYYASIGIFLAFAIALNQFLRIEDFIRTDYSFGRAGKYFIFYAVAYYGGTFIMAYFKGRWELLRNPKFLILSATGLLVFAMASGFPYMSRWILSSGINVRVYYWAFACAVNAAGVPLVCIPLWLIYRLAPMTRGNGYGLTPDHLTLRPYFVLLALIAPIILIASLGPHFTSYYPTYKPNPAAEVFGWPTWAPVAIYEFCYGIDFFDVELFFRGFLVIGLARLLGTDAIIPMVTLYCVVHFGKPVGEQISSIIGGYILGIIAYNTRSVWGGVIIHVGVAWVMELTAWLYRSYSQSI